MARRLQLTLTSLLIGVPCAAEAVPFTGIYDIVAETGEIAGSSFSGFIEFANAPTATDTFSLTDSFVVDFAFSSTLGTGFTVGPVNLSVLSGAVSFDSSLGAATLVPIYDSSRGGYVQEWVANGDVAGEALFEILGLGVGALGVGTGSYWGAEFDEGNPNFNPDPIPTSAYDFYFQRLSVPAWTLVLRSDVVSVPEPGTLSLLGAGLLAMGFRRRRRKA